MSNEDHSLWIVFNGEIFNFVELKTELEKLGHRFRTHSDTEIILHAFESWDIDCFSRFNGQWALALWNTQTKTLVLSRDRIGVRPLFIHESNGRVLFGSEMKAIFADPVVPRVINPQGLDQTFTYWASIAPVTVFQGIEELPPGSVRIYKPGNEKRRGYTGLRRTLKHQELGNSVPPPRLLPKRRSSYRKNWNKQQDCACYAQMYR